MVVFHTFPLLLGQVSCGTGYASIEVIPFLAVVAPSFVHPKFIWKLERAALNALDAWVGAHGSRMEDSLERRFNGPNKHGRVGPGIHRFIFIRSSNI